MTGILIYLIIIYCVLGRTYFKIINKSYELKLTKSEINLYKKLEPFDKLFTPYYHVLNFTYKRNNVKKAKNARLEAFEDRQHDWLSEQTREETKLRYELSESIGIKILHESNCDARVLREQHRMSCDANGIDNGL